MSLPKPDLHIRLSEEAMAALRSVTYAEQGEDFPIATMAAPVGISAKPAAAGWSRNS